LLDRDRAKDQIAFDDTSSEATMPSKQTRRSISVRGATYAALREYCETHQRSMSDIVEELLSGLLGADAVPLPTRSPTAPKATPKLTSVPATSVKTAPRPAVAAKVVRAASLEPAPAKPVAPSPAIAAVPVEPVLKSVGRPAPTPAEQVVAPRIIAPKNDYRNIRF
jgi:hypothetical protein